MSEPTKQTTGEQVLEMCGPMPTAPTEDSYFFNESHVRIEMPLDSYRRLRTYHEYVAVWSVCVATLP